VNLAKSIIADFHSVEAAAEAEQAFVNQFSKGQMPNEIEETLLAAGNWKILDILSETGLAGSKGEAKRLIQQGGVKLDGEKISDVQTEISLTSEKSFIIQAGKRKFLEIKSVPPA
jgi:tyrosyl-tRNA synthetase